MIQVLNGLFRICQGCGGWGGWDWGWGCLWGLDGQVREAPVEQAGQPPVGVAEDVHRRGDQHGAQDERVQRDRGGQPDAELGDVSLAQEGERQEHEDHDRRRGGDDPSGLGLIELSRGLSAAERAGSVTPLILPAASPVSRVQQAFGARIGRLPEACRRAVLVAALGGLADLAEVSRAIAASGGSLTDLAAGERAGLVRVTPAGVIFSHPLDRAAVLAGSDVAERAAAHRALAGVLDGDRRAWHLAALADGPDEQVAAELDAAAQRAGRRGSRAAASAAYERTAALSASPAAKPKFPPSRLVNAFDQVVEPLITEIT